jgi:hypothetical protein
MLQQEQYFLWNRLVCYIEVSGESTGYYEDILIRKTPRGSSTYLKKFPDASGNTV